MDIQIKATLSASIPFSIIGANQVVDSNIHVNNIEIDKTEVEAEEDSSENK